MSLRIKMTANGSDCKELLSVNTLLLLVENINSKFNIFFTFYKIIFFIREVDVFLMPSLLPVHYLESF